MGYKWKIRKGTERERERVLEEAKRNLSLVGEWEDCEVCFLTRVQSKSLF